MLGLSRTGGLARPRSRMLLARVVKHSKNFALIGAALVLLILEILSGAGVGWAKEYSDWHGIVPLALVLLLVESVAAADERERNGERQQRASRAILSNARDNASALHTVEAMLAYKDATLVPVNVFRDYKYLWGDLEGDALAYNPAHFVEKLPDSTFGGVLDLFAERYRDAAFKKGRYLLFVGDLAGIKNFAEFLTRLCLIRRRVPRLENKLQVELALRPLGSDLEFYVHQKKGFERPRCVIDMRRAPLIRDDNTPEFYIVSGNEALVTKLKERFSSVSRERDVRGVSATALSKFLDTIESLLEQPLDARIAAIQPIVNEL